MSEAPGQAQPPRRRGCFITLEGGEGSGKTTQMGHILENLRQARIEVVATREPGGSPGAEILRRVLLSGAVKSLGPAAEAILFSAARIDHIDKTIAPALAAGLFVVSDRFSDSTRAYQGALGRVDPAFLRALERVTLDGLHPDLTLILDLSPEEGRARAERRRGTEEGLDRFEREDIRFHQSVRAAFLAIAAADSHRCVVIDASLSEAEVAQAIWDAIFGRLIARPEPARAHGA
ncbi:dTMP kinase [Methylocapsa aurea]|uniref:dTMP kinase n=1 Tax=Methylocapsa aurea TaxID=663610 RepID=UPI00068C462A|nr:dTMP kinase [Methylocapsa aurea]